MSRTGGATAALEVAGLTLANGRSVSLSLAVGECLAVLGRSGSGKTLLLRALADLDDCPGDVALGGRDRFSMPAPNWRRMVCYVAAEPGWWAATAAEHFPAGSDAGSGLERLGLDRALLSAPLSRLSTGERQRLALLRALALSPAVLLLDEPTSALDDPTAELVLALLREFLAGGGAIVLVSHDEELARLIASRAMRVGPDAWREEAWP